MMSNILKERLIFLNTIFLKVSSSFHSLKNIYPFLSLPFSWGSQGQWNLQGQGDGWGCWNRQSRRGNQLGQQFDYIQKEWANRQMIWK